MTAGRHFSKENQEVKRKLFFHKKKKTNKKTPAITLRKTKYFQ